MYRYTYRKMNGFLTARGHFPGREILRRRQKLFEKGKYHQRFNVLVVWPPSVLHACRHAHRPRVCAIFLAVFPQCLPSRLSRLRSRLAAWLLIHLRKNLDLALFVKYVYALHYLELHMACYVCVREGDTYSFQDDRTHLSEVKEAFFSSIHGYYY